MKLLYFLLLAISLPLSNVFSQGYGTLRGFVTDSTDGEDLAFCNVYVEELKTGASTDSRGFFFIPSIPAEKEYHVTFSFVGYKTKRITLAITSGKTTEVNIALSPASYSTGEVIKTGERSNYINETDIGLTRISNKEVELIPKGIESDVMRALQILPGVQTSNDFSARYYVRGGASDQNLVLLDGTTVYNPFHALGIFSVIDPEIINSMEFYKGAFPTEYTGRLSSVLNIKTKDGNKNRFSGTANASFLSGKVLLEGPIPDGSFLVTGRKSYFSNVLNDYLNYDDVPFDFYDLTLKLNYSNPQFLKNGRFSIHSLVSGDNISYHDITKEDFHFKNNIFGIEYYQVWEKPLYSYINISTSQYDAEVIPNASKAKIRKNFVKDFTLNMDFTYLYDSRDELSVGLMLKSFKSQFEFENLRGERIFYQDFGGNFDLFAKYKLLRFSNLGIDAGVRISPASFTKKPSRVLLPQVNITYRVTPELGIKAAWGISKQEIIAYTDDSEVLSIFEPYIVIPDYLSPSEAIHYMGGLEYNFSHNFAMQLEGYYKVLKNVVDINNKKFSAFDPDLLSTDGESYGLEFSTKYQDEDIYASTAYTLSWAYKGTDSVRYYPKYDSRHSVNITLGYSLGSGWQASASWSLLSGRPFTQSAGYYDKVIFEDLWDGTLPFAPTQINTLLAEKNAARLPYYHRLDLSLSKKFILFFAVADFEINVINVYNRKNLFYFKRDTGERVNMLPFFPTASLRIEI